MHTNRLLCIPYTIPGILGIWNLLLTIICIIKILLFSPILFQNYLFIAHQVGGIVSGILLIYISFLLKFIQKKENPGC